MNKKIKLILVNTLMCVVCTGLFTTNLSANALEPFSINNSTIGNQTIELSNTITENEKVLDSLDTDIEESDTQLESKLKDLMDTKKMTQNKKSVLNVKPQNKYNDLKIFELVLKSNNISDLMNNLKLTKSLMVIENQSLKSLNNKEDILSTEYSELSNKIEALNKEKKDLIDKQAELKDQLKKLEDEISKLTSFNPTTVGNITYNPNNLLQPSNIDVDTLRYLLKDTRLYELAPAYVQIEKDYGVNALFIVGISALESGWGTSKRAIEDNNLTGFGVYHNDSVGLNTSTKEDNLILTAKTLKNNYLSIGGNLYTGVTIHDVNEKYCIGYDNLPDYTWSLKINDIVERLLTQLPNKAINVVSADNNTTINTNDK